MYTVYREYERRKAQRGEIDFEDVLELAIGLFENDEAARIDVRDRYRAFTVDEYQDVNLLQQTLLDLWLGATRRPLRRRRRLPVDLRLHRGLAGVAARRLGTFPRRGRRAPRGELSLLAPGARAREPARAEARGCGEGAARNPSRRPRAGVAAVRLGGGGGRVARVGAAGARSGRHSVRGRGDPLPDECAAGRLRRSAARRRPPVPGLVAPCA